jgi:hypothetical protein
MGYLIFQITLFTYILATAGYIVNFWSQRNEIRTAARRILIGTKDSHWGRSSPYALFHRALF